MKVRIPRTVRGGEHPLPAQFSEDGHTAKEEHLVGGLAGTPAPGGSTIPHNMLEGVKKNLKQGLIGGGFQRVLRINGVGYKAEIAQGNILAVNVGFKDIKKIRLIKEVQLTVSNNGTIIIGRSSNYALLSQYLSQIVALRPASKDKYKGKGIIFAD